MSLANVFLISAAEIFGDFGYKDFARGGGSKAFAKGTIGYMGVIYFLIRSLRVGNVLYVNGMWDGLSAILETIAAYFILGERLNTKTQYLGLMVIIAGIFMLRVPDSEIPY